MTDTKYFALDKQMTSRHLFREINEQTRWNILSSCPACLYQMVENSWVTGQCVHQL